MKLSHQTFGTGQPIVILHGLFGSADNWRSLAKQLATQALVITVDLRNHGRSPHCSEQTYALMSDDLVQLLQELNLKKVDIMGHSIGGKVAMDFSLRYPQWLRRMVVVDIAPKQYPDEHSAIFKALLAINLSLYSSRNQVDNALKLALPNKAVRQFLLMNLNLNGEQLDWRINLQALYDNYPEFLAAVCESEASLIPSCFIRGGQSNYISSEDEDLIKSRFPLAQLTTIKNAGHWVHADAPQQFLTTITEFFDYA
jgi:esterase